MKEEILYHTVPSNLIRSYMPKVPVLLTAASFTRLSRQPGKGYYLRTPHLPAHITVKGADCGGFVATLTWGGRYRFTVSQYIDWLFTWCPQWAATMDLCCLTDGRTKGYPGEVEVRRRQDYTSMMAWWFWERARDVPWTDANNSGLPPQ